jgi:metallophosphoesterase superfamily enzyme
LGCCETFGKRKKYHKPRLRVFLRFPKVKLNPARKTIFVIPLIHVCLSGVNFKVRHIAWNPSFTDVIAILLMDGQVILVKLTGTVATVSASLQATATAGKV